MHVEKSKVLLVDDDTLTLASREAFLRSKYDVRTATSVSKAKSIIRNIEIDVVVVDLAFEGQEEDGIDLIDYINENFPKISILVLSGDVTTKRVADAMRRPIVDFIAKQECDLEETLLIAIEKAADKRESIRRAKAGFSYRTHSPLVLKVISTLDRILANPTQASILILGESGTGKEFLARHIGSYTGKSVISANMANISKELAESTLFGHVKGAFTGAVNNRVGLFEQAHNGILFLDEIAECPIDVQPKLLRALQEREVQPVGSNSTRKVSVRFVTATHKNLELMVERGEFRLDLFQRINAFTIRIPALRERPEDIIHYTNTFLDELAGDKPFRIESSGLDTLLSHNWPGNIRELRNLIERLCILSDRRVLDKEAIDEMFSKNLKTQTNSQNCSRPRRIEYMNALEATNGNREHAARRLNVHRTTFFRNLKTLGLQDYIAGKIGRPGGAT